ncbi:hypothetical protein PV326_008517, partial [Microctonus aethiopoides]
MERGWERMEREERRKNIGIRGLKGEEQEGSAKAREVLRELGVSEGIEEIEAVKGGRGMEVVKMKNAEEKKKGDEEENIEQGGSEEEKGARSICKIWKDGDRWEWWKWDEEKE